MIGRSHVSELWLALVLAATSACGYHVGNSADPLPKSLKTIAIPAFGNVTTRYDLARMLPEDVGREFISRTRYRVVSDPEQADAVLTGSLVRFISFPTTADQSGRATAVQASVILNLTLRDHATGAVLFNRPGFEFKERYAISVSPADYFDESGVAMMRLSRAVAESVVTAILQNF
ncbi:MAG TPA: LptE family protein [Bryobacteraceae bacterium]|nr:LptE family protein [Bryobacteraceae bacterium]